MATLVWAGPIGCGAGSETTMPKQAFRLEVRRVIGPERGTDGAVVRESIAAASSGTRWFAAGSGPTLPTEVRYARLASAGGEPVLRVELDVDAPSELRADVAADLSAIVELTRSDGTIAVERDLPVALERAVAVLDARMTLARGPDEQRAALLDDNDPEIVLLALEWVHSSRARAMADAVVALTEHADERVVLQAVECIGVVGGPEHARQLVRRPRVADAAHANRLYEALANLGGAHAVGFLEFAVRNEDDPDLAGLAKRALARVRERPPAIESVGGNRTGRGHRGAGEDAEWVR